MFRSHQPMPAPVSILLLSIGLLTTVACQGRDRSANGNPGVESGEPAPGQEVERTGPEADVDPQEPQAAGREPELAPRASGVQVGDTEFIPETGVPAFPAGEGPRILLDEAHNNFHTVDGRYQTAAWLLRQDGFRVGPLRKPFSAESLAQADLLIIANALSDGNVESWRLPTPSALTPAEIAAVTRWVEGGGSLLLIADHMPFPGAAGDLAATFGARFLNGFATDSTGAADTFMFRRSQRTLVPHPVTEGRRREERIDSVMSFTGQAFQIAEPLEPILVVPEGTVVLLPEEAWVFSAKTPVQDGEGLVQGAAGIWGQGRVALWGEAAMFTAQVSGPERRPMGMNLPEARQNAQLLLNLARWLTGS